MGRKLCLFQRQWNGLRSCRYGWSKLEVVNNDPAFIRDFRCQDERTEGMGGQFEISYFFREAYGIDQWSELFLKG